MEGRTTVGNEAQNTRHTTLLPECGPQQLVAPALRSVEATTLLHLGRTAATDARHEIAGHITLTKGERSELATLASEIL